MQASFCHPIQNSFALIIADIDVHNVSLYNQYICREGYIERMSEHANIHIYGLCGAPCPGDTRQLCLQYLARSAKYCSPFIYPHWGIIRLLVFPARKQPNFTFYVVYRNNLCFTAKSMGFQRLVKPKWFTGKPPIK